MSLPLVAAPSAPSSRSTHANGSTLRTRRAPAAALLVIYSALAFAAPAAAAPAARAPVREATPTPCAHQQMGPAAARAGSVRRAVAEIERRQGVSSSPTVTVSPTRAGDGGLGGAISAITQIADSILSPVTAPASTTPTTPTTPVDGAATNDPTTTAPATTAPTTTAAVTTSAQPTSPGSTAAPSSRDATAAPTTAPTTAAAAGTTARTSTVVPSPITTAVAVTTTVATPVQTVVPTTQEVQTVNAAGEIVTLTSTFQVTQITSVQTVSVGSRLTTAGSGAAAALNDASSSGDSSFFNNTGAVVGTFLVVGLAAAAILLGLIFFFIRRRRRRTLDEDVRVAAGGAGDGGAGTSRFRDDDDDLADSDHTHPTYHSGPPMGQYSEYGAAAAGVAASGYSDPFGDPRRHSMASMTSGGLAGARQRNSSYGAPTSDQQHYSSFSGHGSNGPDATYSDWHAYTAAYGVGAAHEPSAASHYFDGSGAAYPAAAVPAGESGSSNDHSDPTPVDQRLNPRAVLDRLRQGNHSDLSLNDDANDYSRPLRVANPE